MLQQICSGESGLSWARAKWFAHQLGQVARSRRRVPTSGHLPRDSSAVKAAWAAAMALSRRRLLVARRLERLVRRGEAVAGLLEAAEAASIRAFRFGRTERSSSDLALSFWAASDRVESPGSCCRAASVAARAASTLVAIFWWRSSADWASVRAFSALIRADRPPSPHPGGVARPIA